MYSRWCILEYIKYSRKGKRGRGCYVQPCKVLQTASAIPGLNCGQICNSFLLILVRSAPLGAILTGRKCSLGVFYTSDSYIPSRY